MYTWIVWKNCRIVGYVVSCSETDAFRKATEKFGKNLWVERTFATSLA